MGSRVALCLVALAGCDQLFGLQPIPAPERDAGDAAVHDTPQADAPIRSCGTVGPQMTSYPIGQQPYAVALADVDRNGSLDILATAWNDHAVNVLLNDGTGAFNRAPDRDTGFQPAGLLVRDLTGDGLVDVMVAAYSSNAVYLHPGAGNGTFGTTTPFTVDSAPVALAADDINSNGNLEVAIAAKGSNQIQLLTQSSGSFIQLGFVPTVEQPQDVEIADMDNNGTKDLVVLGQKNGDVAVYVGNGNGSFQATVLPTAVGTLAHQLVVASLDNNNNPDVLVSVGGSQAVDALYGVGDGGFSNPIMLPGGATVYGFALGDIDGDKDLDLVMAQFDGPKGLRTFLRGPAGFAPATDRNGTGAGEELAIGDLDGMVPNDLVVVNWFENTATVVLGCIP